jgi:hypothetical protein
MQGDKVQGRIHRKDIAEVIAAALSRPTATNKTFEVTRSRARAVGGLQTFDEAAKCREFLRVTEDRLRRSVGLPPMPEWVPPPPELSKEEKEKVLRDPRVVRASATNAEVLEKAKRVEAETKVATGGADAVSAAVRKAAVKEWIQKWREASAQAPAGAATLLACACHVCSSTMRTQ